MSPAVLFIAGGFGVACVVFVYLVARAQERRFLAERDGR